MTYFLQQVVAGTSTGFIYAGLALALVLVYQGSGVLNFAQGEMATLSAFLAWSLLSVGLSWWLVLPSVVALSFAVGLAVERAFVRPVEGAPELSVLIVTIGLLLGINAIDGLAWGYFPHNLQSPFGDGAFHIAGVLITAQQAGMVIATATVLAIFYAFFRWTRLGLQMRAAAQNAVSSRLLGIRVGWMLALGWGLAALVGAVAGMLAAPISGLDVNLFLGIMLYAFAAAALGGFGSLPGAVLGGITVGISQTLAATYVPGVGHDLDLLVPLAVIVAILLVRPAGLFGRRSVVRV